MSRVYSDGGMLHTRQLSRHYMMGASLVKALDDLTLDVSEGLLGYLVRNHQEMDLAARFRPAFRHL